MVNGGLNDRPRNNATTCGSGVNAAIASESIGRSKREQTSAYSVPYSKVTSPNFLRHKETTTRIRHIVFSHARRQHRLFQGKARTPRPGDPFARHLAGDQIGHAVIVTQFQILRGARRDIPAPQLYLEAVGFDAALPFVGRVHVIVHLHLTEPLAITRRLPLRAHPIECRGDEEIFVQLIGRHRKDEPAAGAQHTRDFAEDPLEWGMCSTAQLASTVANAPLRYGMFHALATSRWP